MARLTTMPPPSKPAAATPDLLDDALLRAIASRGGVRAYPAHAVLVTESDHSDALFIILAGRVKAYGSADDGREVVYSILGAGETFGEMSLDGGPRSASVMTLEPTQCAVVPGHEVRAFLASHPDFALHLIRKLIRLARASTERVKSLALEDVYSRVARLLRSLAEEPEGAGPEGSAAPPAPAAGAEFRVAVLREKLTQKDIAERVGSSREMVNRVLKSLSEGGYIGERGGRITLLRRLPPRW
jgi:CRP/FNR family cyclic AMP-dependent transcriptional regulator